MHRAQKLDLAIAEIGGAYTFHRFGCACTTCRKRPVPADKVKLVVEDQDGGTRVFLHESVDACITALVAAVFPDGIPAPGTPSPAAEDQP